MIKAYYITLAMLCCALFSACSNDDIANAPEEEEASMVNVIVPDKILYTEDGLLSKGATTRSSLSFNLATSKMVFGWEGDESIGVFFVSSGANTQNSEFTFKSHVKDTENSSIAKFSNNDFVYDPDKFMVAYSPFMLNGIMPSEREEIKISYSGQNAKANGTPLGIKPANAGSGYSADTEKEASSHLGAYDFLISDPIKPAVEGITTFQFKHVGATMRFYMRFPEGAFGGSGKKAKVKSLRVLTPGTSNILVSDATLKINDNDDGTSPSYTEVSSTKTNSLELTFGTDGNGFEIPDNGDLISYMEFYPTSIPVNTAILHITVDVDGVEKYFKSKYLTKVNIRAGYLYQWTALEYEEIIDLTATLQPWNEIVGSGISTDIEK